MGNRELGKSSIAGAIWTNQHHFAFTLIPVIRRDSKVRPEEHFGKTTSIYLKSVLNHHEFL